MIKKKELISPWPSTAIGQFKLRNRILGRFKLTSFLNDSHIQVNEKLPTNSQALKLPSSN